MSTAGKKSQTPRNGRLSDVPRSPDVLFAADVAAELDCSEAQARRYITDGRLGDYGRIGRGGRLFVLRTSFLAALQELVRLQTVERKTMGRDPVVGRRVHAMQPGQNGQSKRPMKNADR